MAAGIAGLRLQRHEDSGPVIMVGAVEARDGRFDLGKSTVTLGSLALNDSTLQVAAKQGAQTKLLQLGSVALKDARVDLAGHAATLAHVRIEHGLLQATRNAGGRIDLLDALAQLAPPKAAGGIKKSTGAATKAQQERGGPPDWRFRVDKVEATSLDVGFRDETVSPAASFALQDIAAAVDGVSENLKAPLPVRISLRVRDGGTFTADGELTPAEPSAEFHLKLTDLALKPTQPYLSAVALLQLGSGLVSSEGKVTYGPRGPSYRGSFALRDFRINEASSGAVFLAWKSLGAQSFLVTPARLDIGNLALEGLDTRLIIDKDKSVNVAKVLKKSPAAAEGKPGEAVTSAAVDHGDKPAFEINIDRLRVSRSDLEFADRSLVFPFGTRIHHLRGAINGLSSRPGAPSQVELDGQVDEYGLARVAGDVNFFDPTAFMDLKVIFRNVEMTRLTPYTATFAGRKINSGKLSLDLEYKIAKRQLLGDNRVVMDQLTLGERVQSPNAKDLPLDLAIAILQDSDGKIDLGLPVSGNLDDPQFSYGQIIWKAITNVISKIVTAPFRALGALFGGGEQFESLDFEPGRAHLTPPEREKLVRLAAALDKRPGLALTVHGVYAAADLVALQDLQLRRTLAVRSGLSAHEKGDPGPISTRQPKVQAAIESLFSERMGGGELAALKDGFRRANPGQLQENAAGKVLSKLTGLLRKQRTLGEDELAKLKGADFHGELFRRLREAEAVSDARLQELGQDRGEGVFAALQKAGAPAERIRLGNAVRVDAHGKTTPAKIEFGPVRKDASGPGGGN
jgi:hypothetical protein